MTDGTETTHEQGKSDSVYFFTKKGKIFYLFWPEVRKKVKLIFEKRKKGKVDFEKKQKTGTFDAIFSCKMH